MLQAWIKKLTAPIPPGWMTAVALLAYFGLQVAVTMAWIPVEQAAEFEKWIVGVAGVGVLRKM